MEGILYEKIKKIVVVLALLAILVRKRWNKHRI